VHGIGRSDGCAYLRTFVCTDLYTDQSAHSGADNVANICTYRSAHDLTVGSAYDVAIICANGNPDHHSDIRTDEVTNICAFQCSYDVAIICALTVTNRRTVVYANDRTF